MNGKWDGTQYLDSVGVTITPWYLGLRVRIGAESAMALPFSICSHNRTPLIGALGNRWPGLGISVKDTKPNASSTVSKERGNSRITQYIKLKNHRLKKLSNNPRNSSSGTGQSVSGPFFQTFFNDYPNSWVKCASIVIVRIMFCYPILDNCYLILVILVSWILDSESVPSRMKFCNSLYMEKPFIVVVQKRSVVPTFFSTTTYAAISYFGT